MKKRAALGLAGLAAVAAIGGTWAYWNQNLSVDNNFQAGNFDSDIVEKFEPEEDWLPGETVEKVVSVKNSGNVDMAVMAKITQKWDGERMVFTDLSGKEAYAAQVQWGNVAAFASPDTAEAGLSIGIADTVDSFAEAEGQWVLTDVQKLDDSSMDLYFVYSEIVAQEGVTNNLVESVTMNPLIQSAVIEKVYEAGKEDPIEVKSGFNYENAQYTMTINAKTVQATTDAVKDVFGATLEMQDSDEEFVINDFLDATELNGEKPVQ